MYPEVGLSGLPFLLLGETIAATCSFRVCQVLSPFGEEVLQISQS